MEISKQQLKDQMRSETQDLVRQIRLIIHQAYCAGYKACIEGQVRRGDLALEPSTTATKDNGK